MPPPAQRPLSLATRKKLRPQIDRLVWGAFGQGDGVFFDRGSVSPTLLDEFIGSDEVFDAAYEFATALMQAWKKRYPGKSLKLAQHQKQTPISVKPNAMQELNEAASLPTSIPTTDHSPASIQTPQQSIALSTTQPAGSATIHHGVRPGQMPPIDTVAQKLPDPKATFHIPNAKAGEPYVGKINGKDGLGRDIRIVSVMVPMDLGLTFDAISGELKGIPATDGEHRLAVSWSTLDGARVFGGECLLIVNPDPRKLWEQSIEPPADGQYFKANTDNGLIVAQDFKIAAASRRGRSHARAGTFRDDDFHVSHDEKSGWSVLIVADGAGSAKYSREGSRLAVTTAGDFLRETLVSDVGSRMNDVVARWKDDPASAEKATGTEFHYLFHKTGIAAVQAIEAEATAAGKPVKDYSTTLLAALVRRHGADTFVATFWMGDGAIAAYGPAGTLKLMGTPDSGEFAGQTRFLDRAALADNGFGKRVRIGYFANLLGILLMTDGVSDPRFETDNGLADAARWDKLWEELTPCLAEKKPDESLVEWLNFFTPGHHDDRTIAVLW